MLGGRSMDVPGIIRSHIRIKIKVAHLGTKGTFWNSKFPFWNSGKVAALGTKCPFWNSKLPFWNSGKLAALGSNMPIMGLPQAITRLFWAHQKK
jgi:hypothetical protein